MWGEGDFNDFGGATESQWKLGGSQTDGGKQGGSTDAIESARIFFSADGKVGGRKAGQTDLATVAVAGELEADLLGSGSDVDGVGLVSEEKGECALWDIGECFLDIDCAEE